jgi:hypothetical protein
MGNSESVAKSHYLQVLPDHFEAALEGNAPSDARGAKTWGNWWESGTLKNEKNPHFCGFLVSKGGRHWIRTSDFYRVRIAL